MEYHSWAGALLIFLPPYSCDYEYIEEAFSKVNTYEQELELGGIDLKELILLTNYTHRIATTGSCLFTIIFILLNFH